MAQSSPVIEILDIKRFFKIGDVEVQALRGVSLTINKGEYVAFLDCDDAWHPGYLAEQISLLREDPELDLIYCDALLIGASPNAGRTFH